VTESLKDFTWSTVSYCLLILYHYVILQGIGIPAQVNLNHMLCPAIRDPFGTSWYRPIATVHQAILCPALSKGFALLGGLIRAKNKKIK